MNYDKFCKRIEEQNLEELTEPISDENKAYYLEKLYDAYQLFFNPDTDEYSMFKPIHDKRAYKPYQNARDKIKQLFDEELPNDESAEIALKVIDKALFWKMKTKEDMRKHFRNRAEQSLLGYIKKGRVSYILKIFSEL